ncbi:Chitin synthase-like protein [Emericellopsis cladophorae]|uniref:chitin synthase n=1 Tax=Emericellopsis cladophorae TaxID=2686198 RepID=A0A9P9Y749_9HYPO|nr:Chitin synthase-like protein [Emericellopsis cladophorae]KAI6784737.1 Chitin synthase-like protein [Emericellopsis cladophorae]
MGYATDRRSQSRLSAAMDQDGLVQNTKDSRTQPLAQDDLQPPRFTANRQYIAPGRPAKASQWECEELDASSSRRQASGGNPFEDYEESSEGTQPSATVSTRTSIGQTPDTADVFQAHAASSHRDYFKPRSPPARDVQRPGSSASNARRLGRASRFSDERSSSVSSRPESSEAAVAAEPAITALPQAHLQSSTQPTQQTDATSGPSSAAAIKEASDVQRATDKIIQRGKRKITFQKYLFTFGLICLNTLFIFSSWYWSRYYYVYLPFIMFPLALNCTMIVSLMVFKLRNVVRPERIIEPDHTEDLVYIMPCYNETFEECSHSIDSLVDQVGIEHHKRGIMVVCDGRVRGPGMEKTTGDYLLEDIFVDRTHHERIRGAYRGWNGMSIDIEVSRGHYKGVPYYCIVKEQNQGKRDSLIVIRSFLHKFNQRRDSPSHIFSPEFFHSMTSWLTESVQVDQVDHLVGMDADTIFDKHCVAQLLKESKYPNTVGVCGFVAVDFSGGNWNIWRLYQNAEYTIAQCLRRLHQSMVTKKVSCLPGCCQLLKICEYTCGDKVLVELFGYHPAPMDGMLKQVRATASEDRNHVCLMLTTHPEAQTRQALRAHAYTDVPKTWSVFLSQRRRWTLGATSNDLLLLLSRHCQWFERILALCNVLVWCLCAFIVAAIGCMIVAFMSQPWWIIMAFASVMIIPLLYYIMIAVWHPRTMRERVQYLAGLAVFVICGPFLNIFVMLFAVRNMDSFGWGKTRLVVAEEVKEKMAADSNDTQNSHPGPRSLGASTGNALNEKKTAPADAPQPLLTDRPHDEEAALDTLFARPQAAHAPVASPASVAAR